MSNKITVKDSLADPDGGVASKSIPVCLKANLVAEYEELERRLTEATRTTATSLAGNGAGAIIAQMDELRAQMIAHTHDFRLDAIDRFEFRELLTSYPPTEGNQAEQRQGFANTFYEALIRKCLVQPEIDDEDWLGLFGRPKGTLGPDDEGVRGRLSDAQFDTLATWAWGINRRDVDVPFSRVASTLRQISEDE